MRLTKNTYLAAFAAIVAVLAVVRCACPQVAHVPSDAMPPTATADSTAATADSTAAVVSTTAPQPTPTQPAEHTATAAAADNEPPASRQSDEPAQPSRFINADGTPAKHRIWSVHSYKECFPDSNALQLTAALRWGVQPVASRAEAEAMKDNLVYVGASPYYHVDHMVRSIPYLVPRAAALLNDIGRAYYDSLQLKGIALHQPIVTSVLRTKEDVKKLQRYNKNATDNSCHLYGTTFDICYNRYHTVYNPDEGPRPAVRNDWLKWVLSEVLRDMRDQGRCYIKYEVKQGCFHITVR